MGSSIFSKHDLEMIEISWSIVKDKEELGMNIMIEIFKASKEIRDLFASSLELMTTDMAQNTMLNHHAGQMIKILNKIVIILTQSSSFSDNDKKKLVELGQRHFYYGLKVEHFKVFTKSYHIIKYICI
jgi:hypothetical protein